MTALLKYKNITLAALITGSIFILSGCVHPSEAVFKDAAATGHHQPLSATITPKQTSSATRENINNADQRQPAVSETTLRKSNISRNKTLLAEIKKQNYTQYDNNFYFKVLKQGKIIPASSMENKTVTLTLNETLTDGTVTVDYNKTQPLVIPYHQLPPPLNLFITTAGENGRLKIYAKPEVAYGSAGIPGKIPPESMSITTIEVLGIK